MEKGDFVEILTCIAELQPRTYDEKLGSPFIKKSLPQYGVITRIDGGYIYVKPKGRMWSTECYESELKKISAKKYESCENYRRKRNE